MPEIGAQRGDHPHRPRARQAGEQLNEQPPVLGADARNREQFLQLIDDEDQLGAPRRRAAGLTARPASVKRPSALANR